MSNNIVLVHGIHDNVENWKKFAQGLSEMGFNVRLFAYPSRWALSYYLPWIQRNDGLRLANFVEDGDHIIAHSNGGNIVQSAIKNSWKTGDGVCFGKVILFSAAATSDKMSYPNGCLDECYVVYNPEDRALKLGALLPFHPFGSIGLLGFVRTPEKAKDRRFHNVQAYFSSGWFSTNHSFYNGVQRKKWIEFAAGIINSKRGN
ncbi:MAG: esterase/lipase family protein [Arenicella sp.]